MASNHYKVKDNNEKIILVKMSVEEIHNYYQLNEQKQKDVVHEFIDSTDFSQHCAWSLENQMRSFDDFGEADSYTLKFEDESTISIVQKKQLIETLYNQLNIEDQWEVLQTLGDYLNVTNFE